MLEHPAAGQQVFAFRKGNEDQGSFSIGIPYAQIFQKLGLSTQICEAVTAINNKRPPDILPTAKQVSEPNS